MQKVDCIVVGAGPAGSACALALARKGIRTVLLERGRDSGEKNMASFVLFTNVLKTIIPDFQKDAPLERIASDTSLVLLHDKDFIEARMRSHAHYENPVAYTAFRSKFDRWFAKQAEKAGAELIRGMNVTGLIKKRQGIGNPGWR